MVPSQQKTPEEQRKAELLREKRRSLMDKALLWIESVQPRFCIENIQFTDQGELIYLSGVLWVEPIVQVRMTGRSAAYMPGPVRYNGWKRRVAEAIKQAIRKERDDWKPFPGYIHSVFKVYVTDRFRFRVGDKSNFIKAIEDAINACTVVYSEDDLNRWEYLTEPAAVWRDDRFLKVSGEGEGIYWEPCQSRDRIEFTLQDIEVLEPSKKKPNRTPKPTPVQLRKRHQAIGGLAQSIKKPS